MSSVSCVVAVILYSVHSIFMKFMNFCHMLVLLICLDQGIQSCCRKGHIQKIGNGPGRTLYVHSDTLILCGFLARLRTVYDANNIALNGSSGSVLWTYNYQTFLQRLQEIDSIYRHI